MLLLLLLVLLLLPLLHRGHTSISYYVPFCGSLHEYMRYVHQHRLPRPPP